MELANIEELVEKYLDATTTLQEEATLKNYFTGGNVAIHLQEYAYLFNYFATAKEEQFKKTINLAPKKKRNLTWFSAAASIVPTVTGVPQARPVISAASLVTWPAISSDHINRGSFSNGTMSSARSSTHDCVVTS